jgi:7-carboxy-7-deazaguanine synthase
LRIAEIYSSRQGEGLLTGTPSVFVRASGCNLRCWFCDTPYTSWQPEGEDWSVEEIFAEVQRLQTLAELPACLTAVQRGLLPADTGESHPTEAMGHVVITGGEPMLFAELIPLCDKLHAAGSHITIETAGTLFLPVACDLMSISPKLAGSTPSGKEVAGNWSDRHERTRHRPEVIRKLLREHEYQLKFVIDSPGDCEAVQDWLTEFPEADRRRVLLMPQGIKADELDQKGVWLAPYCSEHGFVYCPRKHIEWYGARRGT